MKSRIEPDCEDEAMNILLKDRGNEAKVLRNNGLTALDLTEVCSAFMPYSLSSIDFCVNSKYFHRLEDYTFYKVIIQQ